MVIMLGLEPNELILLETTSRNRNLIYIDSNSQDINERKQYNLPKKSKKD